MAEQLNNKAKTECKIKAPGWSSQGLKNKNNTAKENFISAIRREKCACFYPAGKTIFDTVVTPEYCNIIAKREYNQLIFYDAPTNNYYICVLTSSASTTESIKSSIELKLEKEYYISNRGVSTFEYNDENSGRTFIYIMCLDRNILIEILENKIILTTDKYMILVPPQQQSAGAKKSKKVRTTKKVKLTKKRRQIKKN